MFRTFSYAHFCHRYWCNKRKGKLGKADTTSNKALLIPNQGVTQYSRGVASCFCVVDRKGGMGEGVGRALHLAKENERWERWAESYL